MPIDSAASSPIRSGDDSLSTMLRAPSAPVTAPARPAVLSPTAPAFARGLERWDKLVALVREDGSAVTYAELARRADAHSQVLGPARQLVALEAGLDVDSVAAYLACLRGGHAVLPMQTGTSVAGAPMLERFRPRFTWRDGGWHEDTQADTPGLHPQLGLLLSTSGSTGSPKLVRLSQGAIEANAESIALYLGLSASERAVTTLPLHYSFGLSVLHSHLAVGASLLLSTRSVVDDDFWPLLEREKVTSLAGVPHTFDLLERTGFRTRDPLPSLRYLAQAGGRLSEALARDYAQWAHRHGRRMFVMYGQTEAGPRIAYVPPHMLLEHPGSIGVAIPGGRLRLLDEAGQEVTQPDTTGELVYEGPNVMLGYAEAPADLSRGRDVELLHTGDMARRNAQGLFTIVGRRSRFSKLFGQRIGWDEVERQLQTQGMPALVCGSDEVLAVAVTKAEHSAPVLDSLTRGLGLPAHALRVLVLDAWPTLPSGKFDYRAVLSTALARTSTVEQVAERSVRAAFFEYLDCGDVLPEDSFVSLGGDSLTFVDLSFALERLLGRLPEGWQNMSVAALQALVPAAAGASADTNAAASAAASAPAPARASGIGKGQFWVAAAVACAALVSLEVMLQLRAQLKSGRSALNAFTQTSTMVVDPQSGLKTYRPGLKLRPGAKGVAMDINSLGLRSAEIPLQPGPAELRLAVLGASSVAGIYAKTNADTFPAQLEQLLRKRWPERSVNVINAGIEGYGLDDMADMAQHTLARLRPQAVLVYPGFNDMSDLCRTGRAAAPLQPLPAPAMPGWALSADMVAKNTTALRMHQGRRSTVSADELAAYGRNLQQLVQRLHVAGMQPVLMTVARSFDGQPRAKQAELAQTALYYNACLDLDGLLAAGQGFNDQIRQVAQAHQLPVVDLASMLPGGEQYFVDASHFNAEGDRKVAELVMQQLLQNPALAPVLGGCAALAPAAAASADAVADTALGGQAAAGSTPCR